MNQHQFLLSFVSITALLVAAPAMGQLHNFPVLSLAPGSGYGTTTLSTAFGSGVKNTSAERRVFVARVERSLQTVSFGADYGYVDGDLYNTALALSMAAHLPGDSPVQVSAQTGFGWIRQEVLNLPDDSAHSYRCIDTQERLWQVTALGDAPRQHHHNVGRRR